MRSAKPPITSAGVMMAKVIWNMKNTLSGMVPRDGLARDAGEKRLVEAADESLRRAAVAEGQRIAHGEPEQRHHAGDGEALHEDGQHVLGTHQARVEQRESGQRHEQHQRGGRDQPGGVARVGGRRRVLGKRNQRAQQQAECRRHPVDSKSHFSYPSVRGLRPTHKRRPAALVERGLLCSCHCRRNKRPAAGRAAGRRTRKLKSRSSLLTARCCPSHPCGYG